MKNREELRKNQITIPMSFANRELIERAAKELGLTRTGFIRMTMLSVSQKILEGKND